MLRKQKRKRKRLSKKVRQAKASGKANASLHGIGDPKFGGGGESTAEEITDGIRHGMFNATEPREHDGLTHEQIKQARSTRY